MNTDVTPEKNNKLFLPKEILQMYGCKNCIWKSYGQCPKGFTEPDQSVEGGYCDEFGSFILSLGSPGDSISAIMEKFLTYTQQAEAMADNSDFHNRLKEIKAFKAVSHPKLSREEYKQTLGKMEMEMTSSKIWWSRLTESVLKSLSRIADRESRSKDVQGTKKITMQQFNVLLKESDETLKELN